MGAGPGSSESSRIAAILGDTENLPDDPADASDVADDMAVPDADAVTNALMRDVVGNKTDARSETVDVASLVAMVRELLQQVYEITNHHHSGERWFGAAAVAVGETHVADRTGAGDNTAEAGPLTVDAGNDDWGAWTLILGSEDTPVDEGDSTHFDFHRIRVDDAEEDSTRYMIQIALQEDAPDDDPGADDMYTEFELYMGDPTAQAQPDILPTEFRSKRVPVGTKVWMRTRAPNQNTSELDFYLGIHEYTR